MPLILLPATLADIPTLVSIYFASFQNPHSLRAFPRTPAVRKWWENMLSEEIGDPNACFLKIVDEPESLESNGEQKIVAYAKWNRLTGVKEDEGLPKWPDGGDAALCDDFFGQLARKHHDIMGGRGHWYLEQLGTLPEYQGKGCGSRLMKWALDQADAEGTEAYLEASAEGLSLYRKFGFREVDAARSMVEGSGEYENLCMIREARGRV